MVKVLKEMLITPMKLKSSLPMRMKIKNLRRKKRKTSLKKKTTLIPGKRMIPNTIRTWKTLTLARYKNTDTEVEVTLTDSERIHFFPNCPLRYFAIIMYNNIKISTSNPYILNFRLKGHLSRTQHRVNSSLTQSERFCRSRNSRVYERTNKNERPRTEKRI